LIQWRGYVFLDRIRQEKNRYRKGQEHIEKWDRVTGYILLFIGVTAAWSSTQLSMGEFIEIRINNGTKIGSALTEKEMPTRLAAR